MIYYLGVLVSSLIAGVLVTVSSVMTEKFGGHIGGVIASTPSTTVPTSIAIALESYENEIEEAMFSIAIIITINAFYMYLWRFLPGLLSMDSRMKLFAVLLISLSIWFFVATCYFILVNEYATSSALHWAGSICLITHILFGLMVAYFNPKEAPSGTNPVGWQTLLIRGLLASIVVMLAVVISEFNSFIGGIIGASPVISTITLVSVWYSQGENVCVGTTLTMMLGSVSISMFAISFSQLAPLMGVIGATFASYFISVFACSLPVTGLSSLIKTFHERSRDSNDLPGIPLKPLSHQIPNLEDEEEGLLSETYSDDEVLVV